MQALSRSLAVALIIAFPLFLGAQPADFPTEITPEHRALSDELLLRWEQTELPEFLKEKKGVIDEVSEVGTRHSLEDVQGMLAADETRNNVQLSTLVDFGVYSSIQHQTSMKYLVVNLAKGYLEPRASDKHFSRFGVYLELHLRSNPKPFAWGDVELHFAPEILDRKDYHINPAWDYGGYNPDSASPAVNMGRAAYHVGTLLKKPGSQNELVFHGRVPFSFLVKIVVPTGKKAALLQELAAKKVKSPVNRSWTSLIAERDMPPAPQP